MPDEYYVRYMCYAVNSLGTNQKSVDLSTDSDELLQYDVEILSQAIEDDDKSG